MRLVITGTNLPGRTFCRPDGSPMDNVYVGVQIGREPTELISADAPSGRWDLDIDVIHRDGTVDFRGPCVQGKRGYRFVYLTWGNVSDDGFEMFRRAKLMLNRIQPQTLQAAIRSGALEAVVELTGAGGGPRCARVDPPAITWSPTIDE